MTRRPSTIMSARVPAPVWTVKKEAGAWWSETEVNGHVLTVAPSTDHMWTATVDGVRVGRRSSDTAARDLALKQARS